MALPNRGTFQQLGTLTNQQAADAHTLVRDQVAFNGAPWEIATPYIHPCMTRGSDGILYDSIQSSTGQNPVDDILNVYWAKHIRDSSETVKGVVEKATQTEADSGTDNERYMTPALVKRRIDAMSTGERNILSINTGWSSAVFPAEYRVINGGDSIQLYGSILLNNTSYAGSTFLTLPLDVRPIKFNRIAAQVDLGPGLTFGYAGFSTDGGVIAKKDNNVNLGLGNSIVLDGIILPIT